MSAVITKLWNQIWFSEQPPYAISLFRIFYALLAIESLVLMIPHLEDFYGVNAIVSYQTAHQFAGEGNLNLLWYLPHNNLTLWLFFATTCFFAILLLFGAFTRLSTLILYLGLLSLHHRNSLVINSGDVLMHLSAYYLLFSNAGDAFSLDSLLRRAKNSWQPLVLNKSQWAQKLLQMQIALVYFQATWTKLQGYTWLNGTAVFNVLHEREYIRFAVPFIANNIALCKVLTWSTLAIETSMFTLIWIRPLRYWVLGFAVLLHLGIDLTMCLSVFEWIMIASTILFIYPEHLEKLIRWLGQFFAKEAKSIRQAK